MAEPETHGSSAAGVKASYWYPDGETPTTGGASLQSSAIFIDSTLFTHLFCAFADVEPYSHQVVIPFKHEHEFSTFTDIVREKNPQVKTLLSIGGKNADNSVLASMASKPTSRKSFIDSSILIARSNGFHGLDLAWEYPKRIQEMSNFGILLHEWRLAVEDESERTCEPCLLLTAAVYFYPEYNSILYPVQSVIGCLDWVNIIAYDFFGLSNEIGPPAALYDPSGNGRCGDSGLKAWIKVGLPEKKAVFGIPYVGYSWSFANDNGYEEAMATRVAMSANGSINYNQIREFIRTHRAKMVYDAIVVANYCFDSRTLIAYDDTQSVVTKVKYAKYKGLRGYFTWNVGADVESFLSLAAAQAWEQPFAEE